ncbi:MAG: ATP-binding cassette domain-containing protein [Microvirga sp.]|nr:ATP-binding cassette domain-containing protein [Microvirga sp.]
MAIEISGITKRFGQTAVLHGIDLGVERGELIALLGPSGSGKTTLLKVIAGLVWPDAGRLVVDGADWLALGARERRIGLVFQHYALFPHMRVRENIAFGLRVRPRRERPANDAIERRVAELMDFLQIRELADRYPAQLSGGQRQRVALGRALAIDPKVLLLDEPFGALDASIRRDLRRWLRGVHDATGSTTIFVTHDQEEAFELADRVVVMGDGRIEQIGHADEIHDHPATPFVARFMGATVELPVRLHAGRAEGSGLDLAPLARRALPDGEARLFVRPSDVSPVPDAGGPWRVASRASNGAHLRLLIRHPELGDVEADVSRRDAHAAEAPVVDSRVRLRIEAGALFPALRRATATPAPVVTSPLRLETTR